MKHLLKSLKLTLAIALGALFSSCDFVLQYPEGEGVDPTLIKTRVELNVDFNPIVDPLIVSYPDVRAEGYDVRYQVAVYSAGGAESGKLIEKKVWTSSELHDGPDVIATDVELHADRYVLYAWIDYVPTGTIDDHHYLTSDPQRVHLSNPNVHGLDSRDAFAGKVEVDLTEFRDVKFADTVVTVDMERPFGKFKIVTNDVQKFIDRYFPNRASNEMVPVEATVTYTCYFPTAYNLDTRMAHVEEYSLNVNHTNDVSDILDFDAVLSSNYVFICTDKTVVTAQIEVRNASGVVMARVGNITIPIERNKVTIISGDFLTAGVSGGTTIVPDFDGEHNFPI